MVWYEFYQYAAAKLEIWICDSDFAGSGDIGVGAEIFLEKRVFEAKKQIWE